MKPLDFVNVGGWVCYLFALSASLYAHEINHDWTHKVQFIQTEDATCMVNDGKLISLALQDTALHLEVWVDRWFMDVQTADHTKQRLNPNQPVVDLGCSQTKAGSQRWTIHSIREDKEK